MANWRRERVSVCINNLRRRDACKCVKQQLEKEETQLEEEEVGEEEAAEVGAELQSTNNSVYQRKEKKKQNKYQRRGREKNRECSMRKWATREYPVLNAKVA